eukprot:1032856-Prymnesium_polylepis.1
MMGRTRITAHQHLSYTAHRHTMGLAPAHQSPAALRTIGLPRAPTTLRSPAALRTRHLDLRLLGRLVARVPAIR